MRIETIRKEYFRWLRQFVCGAKRSKFGSYDMLLLSLHNTEFTWTMPMDSNRAGDGKELRLRFASKKRIPREMAELYLNGPCSVLEMMVALADRCEKRIMADPDIGDRTGQWFWGMIANLGLGGMTDERFDEAKTRRIISRLLTRNYEPDGKGGLFTVINSRYDMRTVEIWFQAMRYLDEVSRA